MNVENTNNAHIAEYVAVWVGPHAMLHCQVCGSLVLPEPDAARDRHADYHSYVRERFGHLSELIDGDVATNPRSTSSKLGVGDGNHNDGCSSVDIEGGDHCERSAGHGGPHRWGPVEWNVDGSEIWRPLDTHIDSTGCGQ